MIRPVQFLLIAVTALAISATAEAGTGSNAAANSPFTAEQNADFSKQIERELARQGARVALVFRSGRAREDLPGGIRYTHGAFWVHSTIRTEDGRLVQGYAVHNLYHGTEDRRTSYLAQDWPLNFTQGDMIGEVGIVLLTPEMQRRMVELLASDAPERLHQPNYSLISNPFDARFQNCTEHALDLLAAAAWETTDRDQIKANLAAHFEPAEVELNLFEMMFGPAVDERVRLDDHRGRVHTATFASIGDFLLEHRLATARYEMMADFLTTNDEVPVPPAGPEAS